MSDQSQTTYYVLTETEKAENRRTTAIYTAQQLPQLYSTKDEFIGLAKEIESFIKDGK